ncbi:MAG: GDP-mannose 4,6-dehydratase [Pyrinomonadaceae bacterium]|nr:GDP-mannose 4,6-dehydratase [Pyrinomonadaceae bacterium]
MTDMPDNRFWLDRRVFVTGATGLLGSWLTRALSEFGADVVVLIRDWVPESELLTSGTVSNSTVVRGELTDRDLMERILNEYEIQTVFHAAAQTIVGTANRGPISTFEANIQGTWCLLEAARRSKLIEQVVVASSDKAYGSHDVLPYAEDAPLQGRHPYDVSKSCADLIAQSYANTYAMPICITRCGNLFGGGDLNWNRLIPGTIRSALRGEAPVIRSDGTYIRDYFYVEDAAMAYIRLAEKMAADTSVIGHAFNFSNEVQLTVLSMTQMVLRLVERTDLEPTILGEAQNEIPHQYLTADKARRLLGWRSDFSIEEGLRRTIDWYRVFLTADK